MIKPKPIKRSPALIQFSRDHHFALLLIWKIRQGLRFGIELQRIAAYINFFFKNYLKDHFKEEEELLFTHLDKNNELRKTAEEDHKLIRVLEGEIQIDSDIFLLAEFADRLESHIRFEERIVFAHLQNLLSENQLLLIEEQMQSKQINLNEDNWDDTFWIKDKEVLNKQV